MNVLLGGSSSATTALVAEDDVPRSRPALRSPTVRLGRLGNVPRDDLLVAVALAVAGQMEIWGFWVESEQGARHVAALFGLAVAVPLAWRRTHALRAFAATTAVYLVWVTLVPPRGSLLPYLIELVAVYSVALYTPPSTSWPAFGVAVAVQVALVVRTTNSLADYTFILSFLLGAWLAGRGMRVRQARAEALFARAVRAEVEREERARTAVVEERGRIARELHDVISHSVSVMVVQAGAAEQVLDSDPGQVRVSLQAIQQTGRDARVELRRLLGILRAADRGRPEYGPQPGLDALPRLAEQLRGTGVRIGLASDGEPRALPAGLDLTAYRIVQEAVTNSVKHAAGAPIEVSLRWCRDSLEIEVLDSGGADTGATGVGMGLVGMRERVGLYGGDLDHGPQAGSGYRVRARLPLPAADP
jgi:signal transduction histidine kinase